MASVSDGEHSAQSLPSPEGSYTSQESGTRGHVGKIKYEIVEENVNGDFVAGEGPSDDGYQDSRSPGGGKMTRKKISASVSSKEDKICGVCGDKALGCNFDAISCESCKAFFRRNALKEKEGKCLFDGSCRIDINTRRFCPYCRLKKCFTVGMRKDLILGDAERKKRMEKVTKNRQKRKPKESISPPSTPTAPATPPPLPDASQQVEFAIQAEYFQPSTPIGPTLPLSNIENTNLLTLSKQLTNQPTSADEGGLANSFVAPPESVPAQGNAVIGEDLPVRKLTPEENHMLTELTQVYDLSFTVDLEPLIHIKQLDPSLNQLVNQSSITVLRLIKFAKRLEEFVRLPQECQIGILKGCWIHILLLRSVSLYDCERDVWVTPKGDIPTEILKNATGFVQLHDDHVNYCKSIKSIIGDDLAIVVILLVIVLFSPEGQHVIGRELVSNIQDKYLVLLKHYLESKYTYLRSADMYPQLMAKMKELKELAEVHGKYLLDVNPREIEPIMLEILDLK